MSQSKPESVSHTPRCSNLAMCFYEDCSSVPVAFSVIRVCEVVVCSMLCQSWGSHIEGCAECHWSKD